MKERRGKDWLRQVNSAHLKNLLADFRGERQGERAEGRARSSRYSLKKDKCQKIQEATRRKELLRGRAVNKSDAENDPRLREPSGGGNLKSRAGGRHRRPRECQLQKV